jgi:hypothetical protein
MAAARGSFEYPVIASGYIPQTTPISGGANIPADGCTVIGAGEAGHVEVRLNGSPDAAFADANIRILVSPAPGSGLGNQGISFDLAVVSASNTGQFAIRAFRNDTGALADVPYFFVVLQRAAQPWQ